MLANMTIKTRLIQLLTGINPLIGEIQGVQEAVNQIAGSVKEFVVMPAQSRA